MTAKPKLPAGLIALADEKLDREDWKAKRRTVITATQAAVIAGGHPYSSLLDVWNDKTDPEWIEEPNRYLDERATLGNAREAEIVAWASTELGLDLVPNAALLVRKDAPAAGGCTPDAYAVQRSPLGLVIVDAKTTQQNWHEPADYLPGGKLDEVEAIGKPIGVPQHIQDQMNWTRKITGASRIVLAVEQYTWAKGVPTLVGQYLIEVEPDPVRLAHIEARVAEFETNLREDIAPESDIDIREVRAEGVSWDASPEDAADYWALIAADDAMTERGEILARMADDAARVEELEAVIKSAPKVYGGRRVHLIGTRFIAKLTRYYRENLDKSQLPSNLVRAARSWTEVESVKIEPNPEYQPPADADTEQENATS